MSLICALDVWGRWRAIDFEVPKLAFYKSNLIFTFGVRCYPIDLSLFSPIKCLRLSYNRYLHLSLFFRESSISVSHCWFY